MSSQPSYLRNGAAVTRCNCYCATASFQESPLRGVWLTLSPRAGNWERALCGVGPFSTMGEPPWGLHWSRQCEWLETSGRSLFAGLCGSQVGTSFLVAHPAWWWLSLKRRQPGNEHWEGRRMGWWKQLPSITKPQKHHLCCPLAVEAVANLPRFKGGTPLQAQCTGLDA